MRNADETDPRTTESIDPGGRYALEISSVITDLWDERLEGWDIERLPGDHTRVSGYVRDQSELYGVLTALRNMGLTLVRMEPIVGDPEEEEGVTL